MKPRLNRIGALIALVLVLAMALMSISASVEQPASALPSQLDSQGTRPKLRKR